MTPVLFVWHVISLSLHLGLWIALLIDSLLLKTLQWENSLFFNWNVIYGCSCAVVSISLLFSRFFPWSAPCRGGGGKETEQKRDRDGGGNVSLKGYVIILSDLMVLQTELREVNLFMRMEIWCLTTSYCALQCFNAASTFLLKHELKDKMVNTPHFQSPGHMFSKGA